MTVCKHTARMKMCAPYTSHTAPHQSRTAAEKESPYRNSAATYPLPHPPTTNRTRAILHISLTHTQACHAANTCSMSCAHVSSGDCTVVHCALRLKQKTCALYNGAQNINLPLWPPRKPMGPVCIEQTTSQNMQTTKVDVKVAAARCTIMQYHTSKLSRSGRN